MDPARRAAHDRRMLRLAWSVVLLVNLLAVIVFGWDKMRSKKEAPRVRERTLLLLVFATGWLGAWLAMAWFRHKTSKRSFRVLAGLLTVLNPFWLLVWWTWESAGQG
jgi:uncharacterized membrane protein YsdA (DUF1294 family)